MRKLMKTQGKVMENDEKVRKIMKNKRKILENEEKMRKNEGKPMKNQGKVMENKEKVRKPCPRPKKNKTRKKNPQNIPHPFNWSGFCTLDAFHIRIRNDCSEQVCAKSSKQVCVKIFFLKFGWAIFLTFGRFSWHLPAMKKQQCVVQNTDLLETRSIFSNGQHVTWFHSAKKIGTTTPQNPSHLQKQTWIQTVSLATWMPTWLFLCRKKYTIS